MRNKVTAVDVDGKILKIDKDLFHSRPDLVGVNSLVARKRILNARLRESIK